MSIALESRDTPCAEFRFFIYDPEGGGFSYWKSVEARDAAKEGIIQGYLDDEWSEEVEQVVAGEVTHTCEKINIEQRPDDVELDDQGCDGEGTYWGDYTYRCNYDLLPLNESVASLPLIELIQSRRIALTPEHGAGWSAEVYDEEAEPQYTGHGLSVDEAITAALSPDVQAAERIHGIPGTSFQALNAKANAGDL